jgi:SpoVK/Ycf46/Vps4 family AAA+-type ATPase
MKANEVHTDPTLLSQAGVPADADTTYHTQLAALEADLALLEERVRLAVEQVRLTMSDEADPSQRGLLIEEGDVDLWMSRLGGQAPSPSPTSRRWPGQEGGRLARLGRLFGLNGMERAMLLTVLAPELDLNYGHLYSYIQDDVTRKHATLDLVVALWCEGLAGRLEARQLLAPGGALRRHLLLSVDDSPGSPQPLLARPLMLDPRIASYLLGADDPDPALGVAVQVIVTPAQPTPEYQALPETQLRTLEKLAARALAHELADTLDHDHDHDHDYSRGQFAVEPAGNGASAAAGTDRVDGSGLVVWMRGPERLGKREVAACLSAALRRPMLVVDTPALVTIAGGDFPSPAAPALPLALKRLMQRALREAQLLGAIIYWSEADALALRTGAEHLQAGAQAQDLPADLASLLEDWRGCALFDVRTALPLYIRDGPASIELDFPAPSNQRRRYLWEHALSGIGASLAPEVDLSLLTGAFRLTGEQIEAAASTAYHAAVWRAAGAGKPDEACITMRDLLIACRAHSNQNLGVLARKIVPIYTWDDLVLPPDRMAQLREMCLHIRHGPTVFEQWGFDRKLSRGKGLSVLFAGQPGTGKTMAAEVLATDLGLELYKIDLSGVVSKYIGETEKNLERIFQEGQTANAILFFDEADSLFGKRSEVKDSHDRYANIEISYLLQRMEEYDGIVILATNLRKNLDEAFIRRLHGAIEFPMPEEPDRLEIWRRTFPPEAPMADDVDLEFLAKRFKLSGGNIKNIVLEAAFFAADEGRPISMAHLVRATRREHQKIGRLISEADFGPYAHLLKKEGPLG